VFPTDGTYRSFHWWIFCAGEYLLDSANDDGCAVRGIFDTLRLFDAVRIRTLHHLFRTGLCTACAVVPRGVLGGNLPHYDLVHRGNDVVETTRVVVTTLAVTRIQSLRPRPLPFL